MTVYFQDHRVATTRGEARHEFYTVGTKEPFGLNKRTRRLAAGIYCSLPDGSHPKEKSEKTIKH